MFLWLLVLQCNSSGDQGRDLVSPSLSCNFKAVFTVHHVSVDPHAVPSFQMVQSAVTHLTFKAGSMAVDLHVVQDHLGLSSEGFTADSAQIFLMHSPVRRGIQTRRGGFGVDRI